MNRWIRMATGAGICLIATILAGKVAKTYCEYKETTEIMQKALEEENAWLQGDKPRIAITFDDGPNKIYTPMLLDGLKERNVKATFFIIGKKIEGNEEIIKRMVVEGHLLGNHTYSHVQLTRLTSGEARKEIELTCEKLNEVCGVWPQYVRAPFGSWDEELECDTELFPVSWTVDTMDWTTKNVDQIVQRGIKGIKENDIILLHDNYKTSVEAALRIIDILQKRGYEFVTVEELILE